LTDVLPAPFAGGERFHLRAFDHEADTPVDSALQDAPADAVLVLDGLFLHRSQLRAWWDLSVLLDVPPAVAALRLQLRDGNPPRVREAAPGDDALSPSAAWRRLTG